MADKEVRKGVLRGTDGTEVTVDSSEAENPSKPTIADALKQAKQYASKDDFFYRVNNPDRPDAGEFVDDPDATEFLPGDEIDMFPRVMGGLAA